MHYALPFLLIIAPFFLPRFRSVKTVQDADPISGIPIIEIAYTWREINGSDYQPKEGNDTYQALVKLENYKAMLEKEVGADHVPLWLHKAVSKARARLTEGV